MNEIKLGLAAFMGVVSLHTETIIPLFVLVFFALVMDYITGVLAGRKSEDGLRSDIATKGLYKKAGFLCLLLLGFFLDTAIPYFVYAGLHLDMPFVTPFGVIMAAWIVITEAISIIENLSELGVNVPTWMAKLLRASKDKMDDKSESKE